MENTTEVYILVSMHQLNNWLIKKQFKFNQKFEIKKIVLEPFMLDKQF